jgi:predicted flap endonuclease-1-like 5' DNA nuclease
LFIVIRLYLRTTPVVNVLLHSLGVTRIVKEGLFQTSHEQVDRYSVIGAATGAVPAVKSKEAFDMASTKIANIEGIGPTYKEKLNGIGISTVEELLEKGASPAGRKSIAESTGISDKLVLEWVNLADLFRIDGIGEEYSDLLEEAGVDTVPELAQRSPENLHKKLEEVNNAKNLVNRVPTLSNVEKWVEQAKRLPRVVTY